MREREQRWTCGLVVALRALAAGLAGSVCAMALGQGTIELRSSARASGEGGVVRLSCVAVLRGPEAESLAAVEVLRLRGPGERLVAPVTIDVEQVRQAIDRSGSVNWGRLVLRGSRCVVLPSGEAPEPIRPRPEPYGPTAVVGSEAIGATVRGAVVSRLAALARVPEDRLRLTFAAQDQEFLDQATAGRVVEVSATGMSDRVPMRVTVYEGERTAAVRTIRVGVEVKRPVLRVREAVRRGAELSEGAVEVSEQWLPLTARPAGAAELAGSVAQGPIAAGAVLMESDVAAPLAVARGDVVSVRVVSGSVVVQTRARALSAGREGELVRLRALEGDREFVARLDGRGRAVIVVGQTPTEAPVAAIGSAGGGRRERGR